MEGNAGHIQSGFFGLQHQIQGFFPGAAKLLVQVHMGLGIVDPQPQQHRGARAVFRDLFDFAFAVIGHPVHPGIPAGLEPGIQLDGVGVDHPVPGNAQLAQGTDFSVAGHVEAGSLVDQQIQDMKVRIGFHGIMYFQLRDMLPQDIIVFLNLFQRQHQKRSSIPFSQAGDSILGQLEKALFVHYPSPFGPAAAFRLLPGQTRPSLNS
jgi:hypothetical protein